MRLLLVIFALFASRPVLATEPALIGNTRELRAALSSPDADGTPFRLEAQLTLGCPPGIPALSISDASGAVIVHKDQRVSSFTANAGDIIRVSGLIRRESPNERTNASCTNIVRIGHSPAPPVPDITLEDLQGDQYDFRPIHLTGIVRDVMQDEIDPNFMFLVFNCRGEFVFTPIAADGPVADKPENLIGRKIELTGVCDPFHVGGRTQIGKLLYSLGDTGIKLAEPSEHALFTAPDISRLLGRSPREISKEDRHRASGKVIAVYRKGLILVKTPTGHLVGAELADAVPPHYGQMVDLVGFPESDLCHVNLARTLWRPAQQAEDVCEGPTNDIGAAVRLMADKSRRQLYDPHAHGTTVRCRGKVCGLVRPESGNALLNLQDGGTILPIDVSGIPAVLSKVDVGYEVEVTGTCVMESEHWRPNMIFPKIKQVLVVPRTESDIVILARPPWWTPSRLFAVIGALFLSLVGILVWNASLRVLAQRRGHELFKSQIAKVASELRVGERTRLAVELHDSITQNLTGVTLQLDAASNARQENPAEADAMLGVARRSLQSCLDELRRCLWDLRSEALEEPDFNQAIRIALKQVSANADVAVRFNIRRNRLSDATAHAILRIIRELVSNALRHGRATKIRIAGEMLADRIHFAVTDNGCGFETATAPGPGDGHFGLSGIRERLKDLHGTLLLSSSDRGTRAEISIDLPTAPAP